jgi:hypothetical protein
MRIHVAKYIVKLLISFVKSNVLINEIMRKTVAFS